MPSNSSQIYLTLEVAIASQSICNKLTAELLNRTELLIYKRQFQTVQILGTKLPPHAFSEALPSFNTHASDRSWKKINKSLFVLFMPEHLLDDKLAVAMTLIPKKSDTYYS